ncbi:hypothetical protein P886_4728 [Alteromonadaceae bacterium 2753L.S.0a.02]|nr:hypothetical protein P886_4728 [Alteromonadaceae bacterium 2753L.S.0a.02]
MSKRFLQNKLSRLQGERDSRGSAQFRDNRNSVAAKLKNNNSGNAQFVDKRDSVVLQTQGRVGLTNSVRGKEVNDDVGYKKQPNLMGAGLSRKNADVTVSDCQETTLLQRYVDKGVMDRHDATANLLRSARMANGHYKYSELQKNYAVDLDNSAVDCSEGSLHSEPRLMMRRYLNMATGDVDIHLMSEKKPCSGKAGYCENEMRRMETEYTGGTLNHVVWYATPNDADNEEARSDIWNFYSRSLGVLNAPDIQYEENKEKVGYLQAMTCAVELTNKFIALKGDWDSFILSEQGKEPYEEPYDDSNSCYCFNAFINLFYPALAEEWNTQTLAVQKILLEYTNDGELIQ